MTEAQMDELLAYMREHFNEIEGLIKLGLARDIIQELSSELEEFPTIRHNELYLQLGEKEWRVSDWRDQAINSFVAAGNDSFDVREVNVYLKPEEDRGYYVINKEFEGFFDLLIVS